MVSGDFRNTSTIYPLHLNVEDYLKIDDLICLFENNILVVPDVIKLDGFLNWNHLDKTVFALMRQLI